MNKALLNSLTEAEFLLVRETEPAALAALDEDELVELHTRVRRARTKYSKLYRRTAAARVPQQGGRGKARPKNTRDRDKAEVFEDALARVSRSLAAAAKASAAELKAERLAAAKAAKTGQRPAANRATPAKRSAPTKRSTTANKRIGDRSLTSAASRKRAASTTAVNARRQAKRDSR